MCVPEAVAGYVYPGAQVAIFDTVVTGGTQGSGGAGSGSCSGGSSGGGSSGQVRTRILLARVTVLSTTSAHASNTSGTTFAANTNSTNSSGTVLITLAVDQSDAERVITLTRAGAPYLALLTKSSLTGPDKLVPPPFFPAFK